MRYLIPAILFTLFFFSCNPITHRMPGFEVHGIDVSHYQSRIDWDSIAAQEIQFAFVKASEGEGMVDSLFDRNWTSLKRVGIKRGAYHFFRPTLSVYKQARNFIQNVSLLPGDLPPVLDIEVLDGASQKITLIRLQTWLNLVEEHFGIRPIIYTNLNFYQEHLAGHFKDYPVWIARYNSRQPRLKDKENWDFWQYGNRGRIKGIQGDVDFNVFHGSMQELEKYCLPAKLSSDNSLAQTR